MAKKAKTGSCMLVVFYVMVSLTILMSVMMSVILTKIL